MVCSPKSCGRGGRSVSPPLGHCLGSTTRSDNPLHSGKDVTMNDDKLLFLEAFGEWLEKTE